MIKNFRTLAIALIFSGALNIAFVAAFVFSSMKERELTLSVSKHKQTHRLEMSHGQCLESMAKLTFRELVSFLTNKSFVEEGYAKRDLALASLVSLHHFNIEKALSASPPQVRTLTFAEGQTVDAFPGLSEEQFEAIIRYAYQEKWPLTAKGIFALLQRKENPRDESLEQAFLITPEFYSLQVFFQKTGCSQEPIALLHLVCEGTWDLLEGFVREQTQILDFSIDKRRALLLSYLALHSPTAAQLLLRTDSVFALKKLEDRGLLELLALLKTQTEEGTQFCIELLRSPRGDAIWQAAATTLYAYAGEAPTAPIDPKVALARFAPSEAPKLTPALPSARFHIVKNGENLWKIARQYKVKVDAIVKLNGLEKEALFPGMTLKLPQAQGTGSDPPR